MESRSTVAPHALAGRARVWALRAALAAGGTVLALGFLELGLRLAVPAPVVNGDLIADARLGFRMQPGTELLNVDRAGWFPFHLNSLGFRGAELPEAGAAPPGERILLVGDSFLMAWGVRDEEWVGNVLAAELAARGRGAHVYAIGSDDYGTAQELMLLREHGERVQPSTVVLLLFPSNDVINNTPALAGRTVISPGDYFRPYLVPDERGEFELRHALPLLACLRRSFLFTLAEARWLSGRDEAALRARLVQDAGATAPGEFRLPPDVSYLELFRAPPTSAWDAGWRATEALLLAQRDEARRLGARFLVVVIPSASQVEHTAFGHCVDMHLRRWRLPPAGELLDWNLVEERLEAFFHAHELDHVQLLDPLRAEARARRRSPFLRDGHLDGHGHVLLARLVAERLNDASAPGCFVAGGDSRRVEIDEFFPGGELAVDFGLEPRRELVDAGWLDWQPAGPGASGGWMLDARGSLLAPAERGVVEVRGEATSAGPFPLELRLCPHDSAHGRVRTVLEGPGPFTLALAPREKAGADRDWVPLALELRSGGKRIQKDKRVRVMLTGIELAP